MVEKWTLNFLATEDIVDIAAVSLPIANFLKTADICSILLCDKTAQWPFTVPSTQCTCVMIMLFSFLMCHTCQVDKKCSLTGMYTNLCTLLRYQLFVGMEHFLELNSIFIPHIFPDTQKYSLHFECLLTGQENCPIHTLIKRASLVIRTASNLVDSLNTH